MQLRTAVWATTFLASIVVINFCGFVMFGPYQISVARRRVKILNETSTAAQLLFSEATATTTSNEFYSTTTEEVKPTPRLAECRENTLVGKLTVNETEAEIKYLNEIGVDLSANRSWTFLGNFTKFNFTKNHETTFFAPESCKPSQYVAIIIPFRDREAHLRVLLGHLIPILQRQKLGFSIFVAEQAGSGIFNKGRLMNTAYKYASEAGRQHGRPFDCFVFQDVDLLVESDKLLHRCSKGNFIDHLSTAINKFNYKVICCGMTVGGVLAFTGDQYELVNGYPNNFWGWGGEDDAMNDRIKSKGLEVNRPIDELGRYTMIKHERDQLNPNNDVRYQSLKVATAKIDTCGLNSVPTTILGVEKYQLFVKIIIDIGKKDS